MNEQKFRKLAVWVKSMDFIKEVYKITNKFPVIETYGLASQLKRAVASIALNIAEGSGASSDNEFNRFLTMAMRSSYEVMCGIEIAGKLKYCSADEIEVLLKKCNEISAMIGGLKKRLKADG